MLSIFAAGGSGNGQGFDYGLNTVRYARGQNIAPVFEGWRRNPDGSFDMVFGYLNRNYEETLDIPIGPDNKIEPGGPDQGQPTFFDTRRHGYQFSVRVPRDWGRQKSLIWILTVAGRTEQANAFLLPEFEINDQVFAGHLGGSGAAPDVGENKAPTINLGPDQTLTLPNTLTLTASVSDDGLPEQKRVPSLAAQEAKLFEERLWVQWATWRRPVDAAATFHPAVTPVHNGKSTATVSFAAPGQYVLKGFAFDGLLMSSSKELTVTVLPSSQTRSRSGP